MHLFENPSSLNASLWTYNTLSSVSFVCGREVLVSCSQKQFFSYGKKANLKNY